MRESPLEMCAGAARVRPRFRQGPRLPVYLRQRRGPRRSRQLRARRPPGMAAAAQRTWLLPASLCVRARRTLSHDSGGGGGRRASKRGPSPRRAGRVRPQPPGAPHTAGGHSPRMGKPRRGLGGGRKGGWKKFLRTAPPPSVPPAPRALRTALVSHVPASAAPARPPRRGPAPRPQPRRGAPGLPALRR